MKKQRVKMKIDYLSEIFRFLKPLKDYKKKMKAKI